MHSMKKRCWYVPFSTYVALVRLLFAWQSIDSGDNVCSYLLWNYVYSECAFVYSESYLCIQCDKLKIYTRYSSSAAPFHQNQLQQNRASLFTAQHSSLSYKIFQGIFHLARSVISAWESVFLVRFVSIYFMLIFTLKFIDYNMSNASIHLSEFPIPIPSVSMRATFFYFKNISIECYIFALTFQR